VHIYSVHVRTPELPGFYKKLAIQMFQVFVVVVITLFLTCFSFLSLWLPPKEMAVTVSSIVSKCGLTANSKYHYATHSVTELTVSVLIRRTERNQLTGVKRTKLPSVSSVPFNDNSDCI
jgi:hypothetical protein